MKLLNCHLENFASYKELDFNFDDLGLSLVYGATGSGKSSLFDAACWILFGITAKNGSVDEVRGWYNLEECTSGRLMIQLPSTIIEVVRIRGKPSQNDLYWIDYGKTQECKMPSEPNRGKDVQETQKLLEKMLGFDSDLYLSAAYFCEFSPTHNFFLAKTKDQRQLFEKIANLDFSIDLSEKITNAKKECKKSIADSQRTIAEKTGRVDQLRFALSDSKLRMEKYERERLSKVNELKVRSENFDLEKKTKVSALETKRDAFDTRKNSQLDDIIDELEKIGVKLSTFTKDSCSTCGAKDERFYKLKSKEAVLLQKLQELQKSENPFLDQITLVNKEKNTHLDRLEELTRASDNPFGSQIEKVEDDLKKAEEGLKWLKAEYDTLSATLLGLHKLYDLSFEMRGQLLKKAIKEIEYLTNKYLETHFESELKVQFSIPNSDDFEVSIQKNGYDCVYKQLSKGQRQLLRLSFALSVMKLASDKSGIHFDNIFLDEALDGLDGDLKIKAFSLLQELQLQHKNILIVDHSLDFQNLFENKFKVLLQGDYSEVTLEN